MPKGRHLKPDFFTDKHVVSVSPLARLLYQGLWCYSADCGHLADEPMEFKMRILPADVCDVEELLTELVGQQRIIRSDGQIYIPTLADHARIDKRYETLCDDCREPGDVNAARLGNHIRWHQKRDVLSPDCEFCTSDTGSSHIGSTTSSDPATDEFPRDHPLTDTNTSGPHRDHVADGDGDGDGYKNSSPGGDEEALIQKPKNSKPSKAEIDAWFAEWYGRYPKKREPQKARLAYEKALKKTSRQDLIDGLGRSVAAHEASDKSIEFFKHPTTWLNGGCWADEYDEVKPEPVDATPFTPPLPPDDMPPHLFARWNRSHHLAHQRGIAGPAEWRGLTEAS